MAGQLDPSELEKSAYSGDVSKVLKLLDVSSTDLSKNQGNTSVRLNVRNRDGLTALHLAVHRDHKGSIQTLIRAGADINVLDTSHSRSPLMYAVYLNRDSCVWKLLKLGADINCVDKEGRNLLRVAAMRGHENCLQHLIAAGADVNFQTKEILANEVYAGQTALMYASEYKHMNCLKLLLEAGADINLKADNGLTALHYAARFSIECDNVIQCIKSLLNYGADCNAQTSDGATPLMVLASSYETMSRFSIGPPPSYNCVTLLIYAGMNVNTVLMHAVQDDSLVNLLPILVEAGAAIDQPDSRGMTALAHAAITGSHKCVRWLLDAETFVNMRDHSGKSPLVHASKGGCYECVRLLVDSGASVNIRDHLGKSPLHFLITSENNEHVEEILRKILSKQPDVNAKDNNGMTPLMYMARNPVKRTGRHSTQSLNILLQHGMDINLVDNQGQTPLFHCLQDFLKAGYLSKCQDPGLSSLLRDGFIPAKNIDFLLSNRANVGTGRLTAGKLSRLIDIEWDLNLSKLEVGDEVDLNVLWEKFVSVISKGNKRILQFLIVNKVMPSLPKLGFVSRGHHTFNDISSLLEHALENGQIGITKYLIATCYLRNNDLTFSLPSPPGVEMFKKSANPEVTLKNNLRSQPWPLVKLCFVAVSTVFGASPGRQERVKNSQLPVKLQKMLLFQEPWSRLCVHQWDKIPLTFNWEKYEKLPRPRPLLYYWPVGRALVLCDCGECDGTWYKYEFLEKDTEDDED